MSADPQKLLADFKAGQLVNPFEFLICGLRAAHVDLARTAHRRKAVVASASPEGVVRMPLLKGLAASVKALEAASARQRPRLTDQQRDEDCRQVVAALYRLEQDCGTAHKPRLPYKLLVKILSEHLEISGKRVREALRLTADVHPDLVCAPSRYWGGDCDCGVPAGDVCLEHGSQRAIFEAARPRRPTGSQRCPAGLPTTPDKAPRHKSGMRSRETSAGVVGIGPLARFAVPFKVKGGFQKPAVIAPTLHLGPTRKRLRSGPLNRF